VKICAGRLWKLQGAQGVQRPVVFQKHVVIRPTVLLPLAVSLGLLATVGVKAAEPDYIASEKTAPKSVKQHTSSMGYGKEVQEAQRIRDRFPRFRKGINVLKKHLESLPPFFRDTYLKLNPRTYYFNRNEVGTSRKEAWALGGELRYESGWLKDRLQIGAAGYTSQKLYGPQDRDGTLLLKEGQQSFTVLGQAYLKLRILDRTGLQLYRQPFDLPYVNKQDSRMVPNTFEAYSLRSTSIPNLSLLASHLTKIKKRNASSFVPMSEAAGFAGTDKGLTMGGFYYQVTDDIKFGAISQYAWDFMNTFYTEGYGTVDLTDEIPMRLSAQFTKQTSVGDELGGDFDTHMVATAAAISFRNATLSFAYSSTDDDSSIRKPFGGSPSYLSLMVKDFDRADEDAWLVAGSYDFSRWGLHGLSGFVKYVWGDTPESGPNASPDQEELNITLDYRINKGRVHGLWFRFRAAFVDQDEGFATSQDINDIRVIVNYDLSAL